MGADTMKLTLDFQELNRTYTDLARWPGRLNEVGAWVVQRAAQMAARGMKTSAPKAFSLLTNSISIDQESPLSARVGPHVTYAWWVERGRRPGGKMPPRQAIQDWVRVKFGLPEGRQARSLAWTIARSIQRRGIDPQPFIEPQRAIVGPMMPQWALERLAQLFSGNA